MVDPPKELLEFLAPYSRGVQEITFAVRELVLEEVAPCCEYILEVYVVSLIYGKTQRMKDSICYIAVSTDHVNLGFHRGTDLSDPNRILEGTGKQMRHIKIRSISDLERPALRAYLREACESAGHDVTGEGAREVKITVKGKTSAKRYLGTFRM